MPQYARLYPTRCHYIIVATMVISAVPNSMSTLWAAKIKSMGTYTVHRFEHPFVQAFIMFIGEFSCLGIHLIKKLCCKHTGYHQDLIELNSLLFIPPAILDFLSTSTMFVALNLTDAACFQLISGTVLLFVALLSTAFVNRVFTIIKWTGIIVIVFDGFVVEGLADILPYINSGVLDRNGLIAGLLLMLGLQIIRAIQFTYEEIIITKYDVSPSKAVGLEGLFGIIIQLICFIPLYYIHGANWFHNNPENRIEDPFDALTQIKNNGNLIIAFSVYVVTAALYNVSLKYVIKECGAATYIVLDSLRSIPVWTLSLALRWKPFYFLHIIGILLLIFGVCLYFNITIISVYRQYTLMKKQSKVFNVGMTDSLSVSVTIPHIS